MGSFIELNDTLQITKEQGFPKELNITVHQAKPLKAEDFAGQVFEFHNKKDPRVYQMPPVRVFLAENINGKFIYWGHAEVIEINIDTINKTTAGKFTIRKIFTPEEMRLAFDILDARPEMNYLNQ